LIHFEGTAVMRQNWSRFALLMLLAPVGVLAQSSTDVPPNVEEVTPVTAVQTPAPSQTALAGPKAEQIKRGRYLVELIGCGACHTDGAIVGEPNRARLLAGSDIGIAYTSPLQDEHPGVAYAANLTPDTKTGLGNWTDEQIAAAIRTGVTQHGRGRLMVMSWPLYAHMSDDDVYSIVAYLRSIPAVEHRVPAGVAPGTKAPAPYVHFGVYRSK
jgi:mono/diheme cytochrome c family protein